MTLMCLIVRPTVVCFTGYLPVGITVSRGFTLSGRPGGLSSSPAVVPSYVQ